MTKLALYENINKVLAEWNPIGVPDYVANDEYKGYIGLIVKSIENKQDLMICLMKILTNVGLDFDPILHSEYNKDLENVCDRIMRVYQIHK